MFECGPRILRVIHGRDARATLLFNGPAGAVLEDHLLKRALGSYHSRIERSLIFVGLTVFDWSSSGARHVLPDDGCSFHYFSLGVHLFERKVYLIDWLIGVHLNPVSEIRLVVRDSARDQFNRRTSCCLRRSGCWSFGLWRRSRTRFRARRLRKRSA